MLLGTEAAWRRPRRRRRRLTDRRGARPQVYFSAEWPELLAASFRNLVSEVLRSLPLPAVLLFNTDRASRLQLQHQVGRGGAGRCGAGWPGPGCRAAPAGSSSDRSHCGCSSRCAAPSRVLVVPAAAADAARLPPLGRARRWRRCRPRWSGCAGR